MNSLAGAVQSKDEERRKLKQMNNRDDMFDVFIRAVFVHAPLVYIFINITLIIWVAQTIFNSTLTAVPNSIYLITPMLQLGAITRITTVVGNQSCPKNMTAIPLQTSPGILNPPITHRILSHWGSPGTQFCVERLSNMIGIQNNCPPNMTFCSHYCVNTSSNCPITNIKVIPSNSPPLVNYTKFATISNNTYYYTRRQNTPIITLMVTYATRCANDYYYNQKFNNQIDYWKAVQSCGNQGTINNFYSQIDTMDTNAFLLQNGLPITITSSRLQYTYLGFVREFSLSNSSTSGCVNSYQRLHNIQPFLNRKPISPMFTQSLLIVAFILLMAQLIWLITYYCIDGFVNQKNVFVVLISIIEAVIIGFIYAQNTELFYIEKISSTLANCLKQSLSAVNSWNFGIGSPQAFKTIIFINAIFLGLFITVFLIDQYCFKELRRREPIAPAQNNNQNALIAFRQNNR